MLLHLSLLLLLHLNTTYAATTPPLLSNNITRVTLDVRHNATRTPLYRFWENSVGSGHAKLGLRNDWRHHLQLAHDKLGVKAVRFHGLFDDDMGPVVRCDGGSKDTASAADGANDICTYNFTSIDSVFDFIVHEVGMTPYVEMSFMPTALASGNTTYLHYHANTTPPKSLKLWSTFIYNFAMHLIGRYVYKESNCFVFHYFFIFYSFAVLRYILTFFFVHNFTVWFLCFAWHTFFLLFYYY